MAAGKLQLRGGGAPGCEDTEGQDGSGQHATSMAAGKMQLRGGGAPGCEDTEEQEPLEAVLAEVLLLLLLYSGYRS